MFSRLQGAVIFSTMLLLACIFILLAMSLISGTLGQTVEKLRASAFTILGLWGLVVGFWFVCVTLVSLGEDVNSDADENAIED
jgi:hypothetical protein